MIALLLLAMALPNLGRTPGVVNHDIDLHAVCTTKWGRDRRSVTESMRRHVFEAYGIAWARRSEYEVDHLIPRDLGGADDVLNLWPQPLGEAKHFKDPLEVKLRKMVCAGELTLTQAQRAIRTDWRIAYRTYVAK